LQRPLKFVCDAMLGKLARFLRVLGYDTIYTQEEDEVIIKKYKDRILLTKDKWLCKRFLGHCVYLNSSDVEAQLEELHITLGIPLRMPEAPLRCSLCNAELIYVGKVGDREMWICPKCGQPYWKGSHTKRMEEMFKRIRQKYIICS